MHKKRCVVITALAVLVTGASYVWYKMMPVKATAGYRIVCNGPAHANARTLHTNTRQLRVRRWRAGNYRVVRQESYCPACRSLIAANEVFDHLKTEFGVERGGLPDLRPI